MKTLYPSLRITDPNFKYINSAQTDIRETFRRARKENVIQRFAPKNQNNNKPLVSLPLIPDGFVLPVEWFEME